MGGLIVIYDFINSIRFGWYLAKAKRRTRKVVSDSFLANYLHYLWS